MGASQQRLVTGQEWVRKGALKSAYTVPSGWFWNDHTYYKDDAGTWHLYGITDENIWIWDVEHSDQFGHATAGSLTGSWSQDTGPFKLTTAPTPPGCSGLAKAGCYAESHLWAPHIVKSGTTYYMFYSGGNSKTDASGNRIRNQEEINLATAPSLNVPWTRDPGGPLFLDGYEGRDPMVMQTGPSSWVMYYTATDVANGGQHVVAYRTSPDLKNWSGRAIAFTDLGPAGTDAGGTESPYVVSRTVGGTTLYYLFVGPRPYEDGYVPPDYGGTDVYVSTQWWNFDPANLVGHLNVHAAEVVQDGSNYYVSDAGWLKDKVSLYALEFLNTPIKGTTLYALNTAKDKVLKFNGAGWTTIGTNVSTQIVGGGFGLFSQESGSLYRYDAGGRTKVGSTGSEFAVNADALYRRDSSGVSRWVGPGDVWQNIGGAATHLYAGAKDLFATNPTTGDIYQYNGTPSNWTQVGGGGDTWGVNANGLYGTQFFGFYQYSGSSDYWIQIGDSMSTIVAGGTQLYATNSSGALKRYTNTPDTAGSWVAAANSATAFAACDDQLYALRGGTVYKQTNTTTGTALAMNGFTVSSIVCAK